MKSLQRHNRSRVRNGYDSDSGRSERSDFDVGDGAGFDERDEIERRMTNPLSDRPEYPKRTNGVPSHEPDRSPFDRIARIGVERRRRIAPLEHSKLGTSGNSGDTSYYVKIVDVTGNRGTPSSGVRSIPSDASGSTIDLSLGTSRSQNARTDFSSTTVADRGLHAHMNKPTRRNSLEKLTGRGYEEALEKLAKISQSPQLGSTSRGASYRSTGSSHTRKKILKAINSRGSGRRYSGTTSSGLNVETDRQPSARRPIPKLDA